jgi:hypothetical protein
VENKMLAELSQLRHAVSEQEDVLYAIIAAWDLDPPVHRSELGNAIERARYHYLRG